MFRIAHAGVFVALLAVTGCQHLPTTGQETSGSGPAPSRPPATVADTEGRQVIRLLDYYRRASAMDEDSLRRRLAMLEPRLDPGVCSGVRIRVAILLTQLPLGDGTDGILDACTTNRRTGTTAESLLAPLLSDLIAIRHGWAETHSEANALERELTDAQAENGELRKQIEGLKAIEESLQKRGTPEEE